MTFLVKVVQYLLMVNTTINYTPLSFRERVDLWWRYESKFLRYIRDAWYWIRCHTYNRYHLVDIRNSRNGYDWGWIDTDHKLLFASFALLVDFVERGYGLRVKDWKWEEGHVQAAKEIRGLYRWWKVDRARQHNDYQKLVSEAIKEGRNDKWDKEHKGKYRLEQVDEDNLIRLIKVRNYLWT